MFNYVRDEETNYISINSEYLSFFVTLKNYLESRDKLILEHLNKIESILNSILEKQKSCQE